MESSDTITKKIHANKWYLLSSRQRISAFPNYLSCEAITDEMGEVFGTAYERIVFVNDNNILYFFVCEDDYKRVGDFFIDVIGQDTEIFSRLENIVHRYGNALLRHAKKNSSHVAVLSDEELIKVCMIWAHTYKKMYGAYFAVLAGESAFVDFLKGIIRKKTQNETEAEEILQNLTTEHDAMVARDEEFALLETAVKISNNPKWRQEILSVDSKKHSTKLQTIIQHHESSFFWLTRDYEDPVMTYDDIVAKLQLILKDDPEEKLMMMRERKKNLLKRRKDIMEVLDLSKEESHYFEMFRHGVVIKELRKKYVSQALFYWDSILQEIGKRTCVSIAQVRFIRIDELSSLFDGKLSEKIMNDRAKNSLWYVENGKTSVLDTDKAQAFLHLFFKNRADIKTLKGVVASSGRVKGRVRLIFDPDEVDQIQDGEIMVTIQAVPSMVDAIKRCAGIVADSGTGITSHTATLAREFNKPCIIRTKLATQVLKNGDEVDVDADKGVVTLL